MQLGHPRAQQRALFDAIYRNDIAGVRTALDAGANATDGDKDGLRPLDAALRHMGAAAIRLLVDRGADVDAPLWGGGTALIAAAGIETRPSEVVQQLLRAGARVNRQDCGGQSALMAAAACNNVSAIDALLKAGADLSLRDIMHESALDIARRYALPKTRRLLEHAAWLQGVGVLLLACRRGRRRGLFLPAELWALLASDFAPQ